MAAASTRSWSAVTTGRRRSAIGALCALPSTTLLAVTDWPLWVCRAIGPRPQHLPPEWLLIFNDFLLTGENCSFCQFHQTTFCYIFVNRGRNKGTENVRRDQ